MQAHNQSRYSLNFLSNTPLLPGIKPVLELLEKNPQKIDMILLQKGLCSKESKKILDLCRQTNIRFTLTSIQNLNRLCIKNHQGVIARLFESGFTKVEELFESVSNAPLPLIVVFDQLQDPGNAGTLIRTLYALGGVGIIIPKHNGVFLGTDARKTAAGALDYIPIAKVTNLSRTLEQADHLGFHIYGSAIDKHSQNAFKTKLNMPAILVLGNEEHGIRLQLRKRCHTMLHIPMLQDINSLNVAQAGGILISCFAQQKV